MPKYDHQAIEAKWQSSWSGSGLYKIREKAEKGKFYILDMFPYPSGAGLHVGHPKGYIATDIFARMKGMQGYNVLHPMGWDAFGLPAENFALKNKVHPRVSTENNIRTFKSQLAKLGFSYDWEREINTTDPKFYKWTQWVFLKMFERGLAYESHEPIIWCPSCQTGLANEDLEGGKCERCGSEVERKPMRQWVLRITDYAERLLQDLEKLPDWEESIKEMQRNWIGKSEGAKVKFQITSVKTRISQKIQNQEIEVFTTRPDTLFGATYFVLAPEHPLIKEFEPGILNFEEVEEYVKRSAAKSDLERTDLAKDKTGVKLEGLCAINPVNGKELPVFAADYVLMGYGTGAIMAVPGHDQRDYDFAVKYGLDVVEVVREVDSENQKTKAKTQNNKEKIKNIAFSSDGVAINSDFLNGLKTEKAKEKMIKWLKDNNLGEQATNYKIKDWVFSRQRYWGEPIPVIHCEKCGAVGVPEDDLPVKLPEVEHYEPSGTGESPLVNISDWVNAKCPKCGGPGKRETNTMPQWAGSSWYYLRYIDPDNDQALVDKDKDKYWSPVDFYVGGAEHATRHLIYARFWHKFLYDIGAVNYDEPFKRLQHVGLIMAEDGRKMSKRWGNVINPDDIVREYGADAMRVYEMFMGPFSQSVAWNTKGLQGARNFLDKVFRLKDKVDSRHKDNEKALRIIHKTIKKVSTDIEEFKLNTGVSAMMILANSLEKEEKISQASYEKFLLILAPYAPHICEELWSELGNKESIFIQNWPKFDPGLAKDDEVELVIQVNGKIRDTINVSAEIDENEAKTKALASPKIQKWTVGKEIVKVIFVKGRLLNIVAK